MDSNLRKVKILLDALERAAKHITYYALDLDRSELERTLHLVPKYEHVKCLGLWGTYDDGLAWLLETENVAKPKTIMSLGLYLSCIERMRQNADGIPGRLVNRQLPT